MNRRRALDLATAERDARCEAQSLEVIALARALKASDPCSCGECEPCVDLALLGGIAATLEAVSATVAGRSVATAERVELPLCGGPATLRR